MRRKHMVSIILCDDDLFILQLCTNIINEIKERTKWDIELACIAKNSNELLSYIQNNNGTYLIFLDLDFGQGKLNGIDIAKNIKKMTSTSKIVFATNHQEMAMQVLKSGVEPFGFLEKSIGIQQLGMGFERYISMVLNEHEGCKKDEQTVNLNIGLGENVNVAVNNIIYIEAEKNISHGITFHTVDGSILTIISTLESEQERLGDNFIRVHRSYLVHKKHLLGLKDGFVQLSNQQEIPCSFRLRNEVKKWVR